MSLIRLAVTLPPLPGEDEHTLDEEIQRLRRALLATDVATVERMHSETAAPGAKGVAEVVEGVLGVGLSLDAGLIQALAEALTAFAQRGRGRRIEVRHGEHELVIDGATRRDTRTVIGEFYALLERDAAREAARAGEPASARLEPPAETPRHSIES